MERLDRGVLGLGLPIEEERVGFQSGRGMLLEIIWVTCHVRERLTGENDALWVENLFPIDDCWCWCRCTLEESTGWRDAKAGRGRRGA